MKKITIKDLNWVPDEGVRMLAAQLIDKLQAAGAHNARASMSMSLLDVDSLKKQENFAKKIRDVIETMLPSLAIESLKSSINGEYYVIVVVLK